MARETEDVQNHLANLHSQVYLNYMNPSMKIKKQYWKAVAALEKARQEFDLLNDLKAGN